MPLFPQIYQPLIYWESLTGAPGDPYTIAYIFGDEYYGNYELWDGVICKKYKNWLNVPKVMNTDYGNWTIATYHLDICKVVQPYLNKKPNKVQICMEINTKWFKYYNWRLAEKTMKSGEGVPDKLYIHIVCYLNLPDKTAASDIDYRIIDYSDKSIGFMEYCKKKGCKQIV